MIRLKFLIFCIVSFVMVFSSCKQDEKINNEKPRCTILIPASGQRFMYGDTMNVLVSVKDKDRNIENVKIDIDGILKLDDNKGPYVFRQPTKQLGVGNHTVSVRVIDEKGETAIEEVNIEVYLYNPVADFEMSATSICEGEYITFSDVSGNEPEEWHWDFGEGYYSDVRNPKHLYKNAGTYVVKLIVSNISGIDSTEKKIKVIDSGWLKSMYDYEGNVYKTVKIGNQLWLSENLRSTKYSDGTPIKLVTDNIDWRKHIIYPIDFKIVSDIIYKQKDYYFNIRSKYCHYNNIINENESSVLYSLYAALDKRNFKIDSGYVQTPDALYYGYYITCSPIKKQGRDQTEYLQGICPNGWHIPTIDDWDELYAYMKEAGFEDNYNNNDLGRALASKNTWNDMNPLEAIGTNSNRNNMTGFSSMASGIRHIDGFFMEKGNASYYWGCNISYLKANDTYDYRAAFATISNVSGFSTYNVNNLSYDLYGYPVRCVKNKDRGF